MGEAPKFWFDPAPSVRGLLLAPLGLAYGLGTAARLRAGTPADAGLPVICVGNLTAGGAGKTPVVRDLARRLADRGLAPHIISRGYGGAEMAEPHRVDPATDSAALVGDEPLMLAASAPVWVSGDRPRAARAARDAGAGCLILDDGYQDPALAKDVSLVVVDGRYGFGNGFLIPAGPLREGLRAGLRRADALVIVGEDTWGVSAAARRFGPPGLPVLKARVRPGPEIDTLARGLGLAFAGIGHPEKFFQTLRDGGVRLAGTQPFADHHSYADADVAALRRRAEALKARLITTEKDWMRLSPDQRQDIEVLTITLEWDDEAALDGVLSPLASQ